MADEEFNFDEFFDTREEDTVANSNTNSTQATGNTINASNTSISQKEDNHPHPFSARLGRRYVEIIKALAWWRRISQREVIEQALDKLLEELGEDKLADIAGKYKNNLK